MHSNVKQKIQQITLKKAICCIFGLKQSITSNNY